jgi:hypothetical protein
MPGGAALPCKEVILADHSCHRGFADLGFYKCENHRKSYTWKAKWKHAHFYGKE